MADILIRGMEKPQSCNACMFDVYGLCLINKYTEGEDELTHDCPLVELPEHGDLIDADAFCRNIFNGTGDPFIKAGVMAHVKAAPTIAPSNKGGE